MVHHKTSDEIIDDVGAYASPYQHRIRERDSLKYWYDILEEDYNGVKGERDDCNAKLQAIVSATHLPMTDEEKQGYGNYESRCLDDVKNISSSNERFFSKQEGEKLVEKMKLPSKVVGGVKNKGYSNNGIDIRVGCGVIPNNLSGIKEWEYNRNMLMGCIDDIKQQTGCTLKEVHYAFGGLPHVAKAECEVMGREIPVDFFLSIGYEDEVMEEWGKYG